MSTSSLATSTFSLGRESQLDKLIKSVERANSSLLMSISETEANLARAVEDCIKSSTRDFDEALQRLMADSKRAEEQEQLKIFELEDKIKREQLSFKSKTEFLASQTHATKIVHQQSKHALETSHYLNQKNQKVLGLLEESESSARLQRLDELRRKQQVINEALEGFVSFTGFQVVQEAEGIVKMLFFNLCPDREEEVATVTLTCLNESFVLTETEPRLDSTFDSAF